ncbi:NAD(P)/FAD-dependent oxidoreductase [Spectribacter hydrogenooxidans]|uniref:FAD-dependent oxidoreductase n=1 Tax=Spectribacter hydrogenoxidans TaxID=3075608 RepID=A0ABU3C4Q8_9GAMM|nr:FAD-dependent oxidoreductase [Salinisphaera sp. W335]MDT0636381.1 FAD-dependent oxidoreductase [Salinisphaera sp. W335]
MEQMVVVGTGQAGVGFAREFRRKCPDVPLCLVTHDDGSVYYKPNLSKSLGSGKLRDDLITATACDLASSLNAEVLTHAEVTAIDAPNRCLSIGSEHLEYTKLVLACGSRPFVPMIEGARAADILTVNDLEDYAALAGALRGKRRIAIIGGGLIGCEFANDLASAGYEVSVIDLADWPMAHLLPESLGRALEESLSGLGVKWFLGNTAKSVDGASVGTRLELSDERTVDADVVLSAVGSRPDTALAVQAGLEVANGVLVDAYLRSSDPNIFALGDCASIQGRVRPFIAPIIHSAKALAGTVAADDTPVHFPPLPVVVKTPACPTVALPPTDQSAGNWHVEGQGTDLEALFLDASGVPRGFALTGAATSRRQTLVRQMASRPAAESA